MRVKTISLAIASPLLPASGAQGNTDHIVDLGYTKSIKECEAKASNIYFGLRSAAPPLGELRWRGTMDIESHSNYNSNEVQPATQRGPICVQGALYWRNNHTLIGEMIGAANRSNLTCMRSVSSETLIAAMQKSLDTGYLNKVYGWGDFYYGPAVDGDIIRDLPSTEFKRGHFTKVPLIVNRDGYEGCNYSPKNETTCE
ncbi:hypothetical protein LTR62_008667 [Meristemomyces frigidus]|uniref:Carboxylesterase type B domain-containing protein n=1 Tax=Meristemomyces frigidus TaxID=1508187 RepID=A0AAN7TAF4_9PEZI|nr:hypothetical protein LTR62_008667 [Meristemomyces frigidus]